MKAFRIKDLTSLEPIPEYHSVSYLLDAWFPDAYGGTGRTFADLLREASYWADRLLSGLHPAAFAVAVQADGATGYLLAGGAFVVWADARGLPAEIEPRWSRLLPRLAWRRAEAPERLAHAVKI